MSDYNTYLMSYMSARTGVPRDTSQFNVDVAESGTLASALGVLDATNGSFSLLTKAELNRTVLTMLTAVTPESPDAIISTTSESNLEFKFNPDTEIEEVN